MGYPDVPVVVGSRATTRRGIFTEGFAITDDQVMAGLVRMRFKEPIETRFAAYLARHDALLLPTLYRFGFRGCPKTTEGYLRAFDAAARQWVATRNVVSGDEVILAVLPNGTGFIGRRSQFDAAVRVLETERFLRTAENIGKGPAAAAGYLLLGHEGSDLGSFVDGVAQSAGLVRQARAQYKALSSTPVERPVAAMVAEQQPGNRGTDSRGLPAGRQRLPAPPPAAAKPSAVPPTTPPSSTPDSSTGQPAQAGAPAPAAKPKPQVTPPAAAPAAPPAGKAKAAPTTPPGGAGGPGGGGPGGGGPGDVFSQRRAAYLRSMGGRVQDPDDALTETFRRSGNQGNSKLSRAATPELTIVDHLLGPDYVGRTVVGPGGQPTQLRVVQVIAVKPSTVGRSVDWVLVFSDGSRSSMEVSTVTSAPGKGAALRAKHAARVPETLKRLPVQSEIEGRLKDKGVQLPNKKPLQLSRAPAAAGRPGGGVAIFVQQPVPNAEAMCRAAMHKLAPQLSHFVEDVTFGFWATKDGRMGRRYITFDRQPNGSYLERQ